MFTLDYLLNNKEVITLLGILLVFIVGILNLTQNVRTFSQRIKNEDRNRIQERLCDFYAPLLAYLNISASLSTILKLDKEGGNNYRILINLANPETRTMLMQKDNNLLIEIMEIGKKIETLIIKKSGLVEDKKFLFNYDKLDDINSTINVNNISLLSKALVHIRIFKLIYDGKLEYSKVKDVLETYVFPRELTVEVTKKLEELQFELTNPRWYKRLWRSIKKNLTYIKLKYF